MNSHYQFIYSSLIFSMKYYCSYGNIVITMSWLGVIEKTTFYMSLSEKIIWVVATLFSFVVLESDPKFTYVKPVCSGNEWAFSAYNMAVCYCLL